MLDKLTNYDTIDNQTHWSYYEFSENTKYEVLTDFKFENSIELLENSSLISYDLIMQINSIADV